MRGLSREERMAKRKERIAEFERALSAQELSEKLEEAHRTGLLLRKTPHQAGPGAAGCWLGGAPTLPDDIDWPMYAVGTPFEVPLGFLGQINLASMPRPAGLPSAPDQGTLFFFVDLIVGPLDGWPKNAVRVIYVSQDVTGCSERQMPPMPDRSVFEPLRDELLWADDDPEIEEDEFPSGKYTKWCFTFEPFETKDLYLYNNKDFFDAAREIVRQVDTKLDQITQADRLEGKDKEWSSSAAQTSMFGEARSSDPDIVSLLVMDGDWDTGIGFPMGIHQILITHADLAAGNFDNVTIDLRGV